MSTDKSRYCIGWARHQDEVVEAQKLRFRVFSEELAADLNPNQSGLDVDRFDLYCEHLLVRELESNAVVGTYRVLTPSQAAICDGYYAESLFYLPNLRPIMHDLVEVGRACVSREHRNSVVMLLLWRGLGDFMRTSSDRWMMGCTSISLSDGGYLASSLVSKFTQESMLEPRWTVEPKNPLQNFESNLSLSCSDNLHEPALLRAYLKLGAKICGPPSVDKHFNSADFLTLLDCNAMSKRYASHFMG